MPVDFRPKVSGQSGVQFTPKEEEVAPEKSLTGKIQYAIGDFLVGNTARFGKTIGESFGARTAATQLSEQQAQLNPTLKKALETIRAKKARGEDTTALERLYKSNTNKAGAMFAKDNQVTKMTTGQVVGQGLGVVADIASFGTYGKGFLGAGKGLAAGSFSRAKAIPSLATEAAKILPKDRLVKEIATQTAKTAGIGAGMGYGYDVSGGLQEGEGGKSFIPGLGTAIGAAIPLAAGTVSMGKQVLFPSKGAAVRSYKTDLDDMFFERQTDLRAKAKAASQGKDPTDLLVQKASMGDQVPIETVKEGGRIIYKTETGVEKLWNDVNDLEEVLSTGLKSSPKRVDLNSIERQVLGAIQSNAEIGATGNTQKAMNKARIIFRDIRRNPNYGKTLNLEQVNKIKQAQWKEARSLFAKMAPDYEGNVNFQIGETIKNTIEQAIPDAPVKALNQLIGHHIETAKILQKMNGSVAKNGKMGKYFFRTIGAIAGSHGGPLGTVAGAVTGDKFAEIGARMGVGNPFRNAVLNKEAYKNPKVVDHFIEYLAKTQAQNFGRVALPKKPAFGVLQLKKSSNASLNTPANTTANTMPNMTNMTTKLPQLAKRVKVQDANVQIRAKEAKEEYISNLENELSIAEEEMLSNPSRGLMKYTNKRTGELPEVTGQVKDYRGKGNPNTVKGKFALTGDSFVTESGFVDSEEARASIEKYNKQKEHVADLKTQIAQEKESFQKGDTTVPEGFGTQKLTQSNPNEAFGAVSGFEQDEEGNWTINPEKAALGVLGVAGATKAQKALKNLRPDDVNIMMKFIDSSRLGTRINDAEFDMASKLAEKFGISMDKGLNGVSKEFEDVLTGIKKVPATNLVSKVDNALLVEARKYKTAEEFVGKMKGSSTQYGEYAPHSREYLPDDFKNLSELGVDPEKTVTIYRGIDDLTGKVTRKINDGDFVTSDFDSAASYAGKDSVVSMKVKAKHLYNDNPRDFTDDPFYTGAQYVYSTQKIKPLPSDSQLTDIWKQAHK